MLMFYVPPERYGCKHRVSGCVDPSAGLDAIYLSMPNAQDLIFFKVTGENINHHRMWYDVFYTHIYYTFSCNTFLTLSSRSESLQAY